MKHAAWLAIALALAATRPAAAQDYIREDLRIPMKAAGPRGLEALLIRPGGSKAYPLALISHGSPADPMERRKMSPYWHYQQAVEFARRGFAALVVMRRGYGDSGGEYGEDSCCELRFYLNSAQVSLADLRAAIAAMKGRTDVTTQGMIAVGISAGGYASIVLAADPPPGFAAAISFAGGRSWLRSMGVDVAHAEKALVASFRTFGTRAGKPTLWIYAVNDSYFGPDLVRRMHAAFTSAGGNAQLISVQACCVDGHFLFSRAIPTWTPLIDDFLRTHNLGQRDVLPLPTPPDLPYPSSLSAHGRALFAAYLTAGPRKAFAISSRGAAGSSREARSTTEAQAKALENCRKQAPDCVVYAIDDELAATTDAAPASAKQ
jgi:dienelactone hydrolase